MYKVNIDIRLVLLQIRRRGHIEKIPPEKTTFKRPYLLELKLLLNLQKKIVGCRHQTRKFIKIAATQLLCCEFYKIFKNNFLAKHLWITAFENWSYFPASFPVAVSNYTFQAKVVFWRFIGPLNKSTVKFWPFLLDSFTWFI